METVYETTVGIDKILEIVSEVKKKHRFIEGEVSCSLEKINDLGAINKILKVLEKDTGELSLKSRDGKFEATGEVKKEVFSSQDVENFIHNMKKISELREIRLNITVDGTKITSYRFGEGDENHTLYVIGRESVVDLISKLVGERKVQGKEVEEESEEYCIYCGAYKGKRKTCPSCGR